MTPSEYTSDAMPMGLAPDLLGRCILGCQRASPNLCQIRLGAPIVFQKSGDSEVQQTGLVRHL